MPTITTDPRKILEAVLAVQLRDDDGGRPTVADALPDDLARQAKAACTARSPVHAVLICRTCEKAYLPCGGGKIDDPLPCGHTPSAWFVGNQIISHEADARLVHWADKSGLLDEIIDRLEDDGGSYDPCGCGRERLQLPGEV